MNIIWQFADLEIPDLSQINDVEASPEAKAVIDYAVDKLTSWHADLVKEDMKKLPKDQRDKIFSALEDILHTQ